MAPQPESDAGAQYAQSGDWPAALECFKAAAARDPGVAAHWSNACAAALQLELPDEAAGYGARAVELEPENPVYAAHFGRALEASGQLSEAAVQYARALRKGGEAWLYLRLGAVLNRLYRFVAAALAREAGLAKLLGDAYTWTELANNWCLAGEHERAHAAWAAAIRLDPLYELAHSQRLVALHYRDHAAGDGIFEEHRRWGAAVESRIVAMPPARSLRASRIRLGYLAPHPVMHALASFTTALMEHHDQSRFEVVRFTDAQDPTTGCHATAGLTNPALAALIRECEIDVLVDLGGHTAPRGRLLAVAERPARLHVTAIGYPDTTGLTRIDYRLTDSVADPPGAERRHTERLLRLDPCFLCYTPSDLAPAVMPRSLADPFTFGCFNAFPKWTGATLRAWARILEAVPGSRLAVKCLEFVDPDVRSAAIERLMEAGVDPDRVDVLDPPHGQAGHLGQYQRVDVFLDCFPYNGTTTTCEALWMGVPGVTLAGETHVSRVGASLLAAAGLDSWVVASWDDYVDRAVEAARKREDVHALRAGMRRRLARSPLLDGLTYTRRFEGLLLTALDPIKT